MLPERYELFLKEDKGSFKKGWTRWNETTFATPWAGEPTPWEEWHIVANKAFFHREISSFRDACIAGSESTVTPEDAYNVALVMAACYESSRAEGRKIEVKS